jgi:hypothetical protein
MSGGLRLLVIGHVMRHGDRLKRSDALRQIGPRRCANRTLVPNGWRLSGEPAGNRIFRILQRETLIPLTRAMGIVVQGRHSRESQSCEKMTK